MNSSSTTNTLVENGPECLSVSSPKLLQDIRTYILGLWPKRNNDYFPGPLPVSLEIRNFSKLKNLPYVISVKSDGTRFFLLNFKGQCYMIDRTFKVSEVSIKFKGGTMLFDGELVRTNSGTWSYMIHDCICISDNNISAEYFDQRYEAIQHAYDNFYLKDPPGFEIAKSYIKLNVKTFFKFDKKGIELFKAYLQNVDHKTDGYIITPIEQPIHTGTQHTLFKWKPVESHTFDFRITNDNTRYTSYIIDKNKEIPYGEVASTAPGGIEFGIALKKIGYKSGDIVECSYNKSIDSFDPILVRSDKSHPNNLNTIEKTLLNIREAITEETLFGLV
jgi:mRNA capping enzyme, catalytic domain/mRNA capping enzyme, C-terminal domain